jgi:hypothetical protein
VAAPQLLAGLGIPAVEEATGGRFAPGHSGMSTPLATIGAPSRSAPSRRRTSASRPAHRFM